ncbi:integrin alpha-M-like [Pangshura tecta]
MPRGCGGTHHLPEDCLGVRAERGAVRKCQHWEVRAEHGLRAPKLHASYPSPRGWAGWAALPGPHSPGFDGASPEPPLLSPCRVIVRAPLQMGDVNETGKVYKCDLGSGQCHEIPIQRPADAVKMSLGISLAVQGSQILVCGPTVHQACGENMYVKGYCFLLDQSLRQPQCILGSLPECPKRPTDIVFLIDGSGSVGYYDFETMKTLSLRS